MEQDFEDLGKYYNLTEEEFKALKSTHDGDTVQIPQATIQKAYTLIQEYINKVNQANKILVPFLNAVAIASAFIPYAGFIIAPTLSAFTGKLARSNFDKLLPDILWSRNEYRAIYSVENNTCSLAQSFAEANLVSELDKRVRYGGKISFKELGKLVNINDSLFKDACNALAITVLQTKTLLAQNKGWIKTYEIATYDEIGFNPRSASSRLGSRQGTALRATLAYELENAQVLPQSFQYSESGNTTEYDIPEANISTLRKIFNFYKDGIAENWKVFTQKPTPDGFIPKIQNEFVVNLTSADGLEEMINAYNLAPSSKKTRFILDLPALRRD